MRARKTGVLSPVVAGGGGGGLPSDLVEFLPENKSALNRDRNGGPQSTLREGVTFPILRRHQLETFCDAVRERLQKKLKKELDSEFDLRTFHTVLSSPQPTIRW